MRSLALCGLLVLLQVFILNLYLALIRFLRVIHKNLSHVDPVFCSLWEWHSPIIYLAVHCYWVIDEHNMLLESLNSDRIISRLKTVRWAMPLDFSLFELLLFRMHSKSSECLFVCKTTKKKIIHSSYNKRTARKCILIKINLFFFKQPVEIAWKFVFCYWINNKKSTCDFFSHNSDKLHIAILNFLFSKLCDINYKVRIEI